MPIPNFLLKTLDCAYLLISCKQQKVRSDCWYSEIKSEPVLLVFIKLSLNRGLLGNYWIKNILT